MEKIIQAIGAPFNISWSSCGTRIPKTFHWTTSNDEVQLYIDSHLTHGLDGKKHNKKFGWFCESRIVKQALFNEIKQNLNRYRESYHKLFTCDSELITLDPSFFVFCYAGSNLPWTPEEEYGIHNKSKKVSFLCSPNSMSDGHRYRLSWAEKLKNKVDLYGGVCGSKRIGVSGKEHYHHKRKTESVNDYRFSIAFENTKYDTYFTEKITDCFANGVIPIYYGTDTILNYFDINGIITLHDNLDINTLTPELYESKIESIKTNLELVKNLEMADDMIYRKIQELI